MPRTDTHWQLRAFRLGAKVTWAMAAASLLYAATTWSHPHRALLLVITLGAAIDGAVVWRVTSGAEGRRVDGLLMAWNAAHVAAAASKSATASSCESQLPTSSR